MSFPLLDVICLSLFVATLGGLSIVLHEWAHATVASRGGDITLREKGYLSLNPFKYSERLVSLAFPALVWALGSLPLPGTLLYLNNHLLRNRRWRSATAAAGPAMTGVLAIAFSLPFILGLPIDPKGWLGTGFAVLADWMFSVLLLSLLPIPGLDGYAILEPWLPEAVQKRSRFIQQFGCAVLFSYALSAAKDYDWAEHRLSFGTSISTAIGIPESSISLGFELLALMRTVLLLLTIAFALGYARWAKTQQKSFPDREQIDREAQRLKTQREANQAKLEQDPHNYGALVDQGNVLMQQRAYVSAVKHYSLALEHYPEDANFWFERGFAQARQRKFAEALPDYDQSLKYRPKSYRTLHVKADALLMLNRNEEAVDTFDQVLRYNPSYAHIWHDRGLILQRLGRDEEALKSQQRAVKLNADNDAHWAALAHAYQQLGKQEDRDRTLSRGLKRHPQSPSLWDFKLNQTLDAKDYLGVLELCDTCEPFLKQQDATVPYSRAIALTKLGRYSDARAAYEKALEQEPKATWFLLNRALLLHDMLCPDDALADIERLLQDEPNNANYQEFKAMFLFGAKRYDEMLPIYEALLQKEALKAEERARLLTSKGYALRKLEDYDAAMEHYEQALTIVPGYSQAWVKRGELRGTLAQQDLAQQDLALADLDRAIELEADSPPLWKTRIYALYDMGLYEQALNGCEKSLALEPSISIWIEKARCHLALQETAEAKEALTKAQTSDAPTTERIVAEKPDLAELWQGLNRNGTASEKSTAS